MAKLIGITGGVGCGKSSILSHLEQRGDCEVVYADLVAKELEEPGKPCYQPLIDAFGSDILSPEDQIIPGKLAEKIFASPEALEKANAIIHPAVEEEIRRRMDNCKKPYFILEAALLLERRYDTILEELWYVYASEEVRRERLKSSRGYSDEKISAIMASQLPEEVFRSKCSVVIDNNGELSDAIQQADALLDG